MATKISKNRRNSKIFMKLTIRGFVSGAAYEFEVRAVKRLNLKVKIPISFILITKVVGSEFNLH